MMLCCVVMCFGAFLLFKSIEPIKGSNNIGEGEKILDGRHKAFYISRVARHPC